MSNPILADAAARVKSRAEATFRPLRGAETPPLHVAREWIAPTVRDIGCTAVRATGIPVKKNIIFDDFHAICDQLAACPTPVNRSSISTRQNRAYAPDLLLVLPFVCGDLRPSVAASTLSIRRCGVRLVMR